MKVAHQLKTEEESSTASSQNVVPLFPITGGKTTNREPWLRGLSKGTLFIASSKKSFTTCLDEYRVMEKEEANGETFTLLRQNRRVDNKDASDWEWHDDELFSHENKLKKVLE